MTKRNPSDDAIEATVKTICRFWAKKLGDDFNPEIVTSPCRLTQAQADRLDIDLQYLWTYASDPHESVVEALIAANPSLYGSFDYRP